MVTKDRHLRQAMVVPFVTATVYTIQISVPNPNNPCAIEKKENEQRTARQFVDLMHTWHSVL